MKKVISALSICMAMAMLLPSCSKKPEVVDDNPSSVPNASTEELVDGKFKETRTITVEIYERGNDGGTDPDDNFYTDFIKEGMLRDHNVKVEFQRVPRWTEVEAMNNLLAATNAPDICVTYDYPTIQTYANMGGIVDLAPYLKQNKEMLPNLWDLLGDENIYWNEDPEKGTIWAIEAKLFHNKRINTFVREDWLKKLDIEEPTTLEQFEDMLKAFKSNASTLLGDDADKMIPFSISYDVGWRADHLLTSFVPNDISDKEIYVNGFDDRHLLYPGIKDGVKKLNEWYNEGLIWGNFALYGPGDKTEDNNMKAGYVGAFMHNWDYPYREGKNGISANLKKLVGEDATFVAVEPFKNDAGVYKKFLSPPIDRKIFFPVSNDEPVASLLYLDWISKLENRKFLQIGEEDVTYEKLSDGSIKTIATTGKKIMNSQNNIDYTITINGLDLGDEELNVKSIANGYADVEPRLISKAYDITSKDARIGKHVNVGQIESEEGQGAALKEKRDKLLSQAVVAKPEDFDTVFDSGLQDYLRSGGQAIIDERKEKYENFYE